MTHIATLAYLALMAVIYVVTMVTYERPGPRAVAAVGASIAGLLLAANAGVTWG